MKVSHPNAKEPSSEELKDLDRLRTLLTQAIADGRLSKQEMARIQASIHADGKVSVEELELCRELIWKKIEQGELEFEWD